MKKLSGHGGMMIYGPDGVPIPLGPWEVEVGESPPLPLDDVPRPDSPLD
jgi:hypothetical protein